MAAVTKLDDEVLARLELDGRSMARRWPWIVGVALLVVALGGLVSSLSAGGPELRWSAVQRGSMAVTVDAVGTLHPRREVEIGSELSGLVATVPVEENQRVAAGDVLATLDTRMLVAQSDQADAEVATARANLRQARVQAELARLERDRARVAGRAGGIAEAELDRVALTHELREAGVELAEAQLARALAAQRLAATNLDKAIIRSPTDGVVLERNVDPGQSVVTSLQSPVLFKVAEDLDEMRLVVEIDEADIARIQAGQAATFTVAAWPDATFDATVARVDLAPLPGFEVVTYEAELHVANREGLLRPGMSASATVVARELVDVVLVPNAALRFDPPGAEPPEGPHVWLQIDGAPRAARVSVQASDRRHTAVTSEVELEGAQVAISAGES